MPTNGGIFLGFPQRKVFGAVGKNFPSRRIANIGFTDDRDANRFLQSANITDPVISTAIAVLTYRLKQTNLWGRMIAIWPLVGGTSTTCALNLRTSLNTITWVNSPTFAPTGVTFNGSNNYGNLNLNPQGLGLSTGISTSFYSRTASIATGEGIGAQTGGPASVRLIPRNTTSVSDIGFNSIAGATPTNCLGWWSNRKSGTLAHRLYKNGVTVATGVANTQAIANTALFLGAFNTTPAPTNFINAECAFAHVGGVLTDDETALMYNIVQEFQTTLGRQV